MQFKIITGTKSEDLKERGRIFFQKLSLISCFIWYLWRIKLSFPSLWMKVKVLIHTLSTYHHLWLVFQCSLKAWKQGNLNVFHMCMFKTASPIQQKTYRLPHQLPSHFLSTAFTAYTRATFFSRSCVTLNTSRQKSCCYFCHQLL